MNPYETNPTLTNEEIDRLLTETQVFISTNQEDKSTAPQHLSPTKNSKKRKNHIMDWKDQMTAMLEKRQNEDEHFVIHQHVANPIKQKPYSIVTFPVSNKKKKISHAKESISSSSHKHQETHLETIPTMVPETYGMYNTLQISTNRFLSPHLLKQEFNSISVCETFWDLSTFRLLAFSDNFSHFVERSKEELIHGDIILANCIPESIWEGAKRIFGLLAERRIKNFTVKAGVTLRKIDRRWVTFHSKVEMHTESGFFRLTLDINPNCSAEFTIDGKEVQLKKYLSLKEDSMIEEQNESATNFFIPLMNTIVQHCR